VRAVWAWIVVLLSWGTAAAALPGTEDGAPDAERIVFFGDSLVHRSDGDHGLLAMVRRGLEAREHGRRFELVEAGRNGNTIADLRKRLGDDVLARHPGAVVLYWDSDVSDVDEAGLSPARIADLRGAYERDLSEVITALEGAGAHVIVTGPTLIGEKPHGQNPKDAQLDAYAELNRQVTARLGAFYVDTRRLFLEHAARAGAGRLTEDGEHLSAAGARLVAHELLRALHHWLRRERPSRS
jgi:lysophospholipase L1-like esterase